MAKNSPKSSEKKDTRSRKVRDLPGKPVGARKAAAVRGGKASLQDITFMHVYDKSTPVLLTTEKK
jgi:type VI protein secretion system component Hcp